MGVTVTYPPKSDKCAEQILLVLMGGRVEFCVSADMGVRTPIVASGIIGLFHVSEHADYYKTRRRKNIPIDNGLTC